MIFSASTRSEYSRQCEIALRQFELMNYMCTQKLESVGNLPVQLQEAAIIDDLLYCTEVGIHRVCVLISSSSGCWLEHLHIKKEGV